MFIDGEWVHGTREETIDVVNPATERSFAKVPRGSREDAKRALDSAADAQKGWEMLPPLERASYLKKMATLIRAKSEQLALVLTSEQGKPLFEARL